MKVEIRLGDDTFLVKSGECYSIDYNNLYKMINSFS